MYVCVLSRHFPGLKELQAVELKSKTGLEVI